MSNFSSGNVPGFHTRQESEEKQVTWSGPHGQTLAATQKGVIDATAVDAGNTPDTTLRGGLVVAVKESDGNLYPYDPDANDGTQIAVGILPRHQDMLSGGVASDRFTHVLVHGLVRENQLVGLDRRAKDQLGGRFVFDRDLPASTSVLVHPRGVLRKDDDYTVQPADHGLLFIATAAATFTLPTKQNGLAFRFLQTADAELEIAGDGDLVHAGSDNASSLSFDGIGERRGSHVLVECVYVAGGTLKWIVSNLGGTTATVA
jgi:hypothetical protein